MWRIVQQSINDSTANIVKPDTVQTVNLVYYDKVSGDDKL